MKKSYEWIQEKQLIHEKRKAQKKKVKSRKRDVAKHAVSTGFSVNKNALLSVRDVSAGYQKPSISLEALSKSKQHLKKRYNRPQVKFAPQIIVRKKYDPLTENLNYDYNLNKSNLQKKFENRKRRGSLPPTLTEDMKEKIALALSGEAKAPYGRTKIMFVGEGRAGKSSTIKALLNKDFDPKEDSTLGFDVSRVDAKEWKEDKGSYLVEHLQKALRRQESEMPETNKEEVEKERTRGPELKHQGSLNDLNISEEEMFKYGRELVLKDDDKDPLAFSIWDFGGQKVFYTLHHLFLTEFGCYVLVFNLNKLLDEKTRESTIEYLRFWLFSKKIHAPSAPILIVGTRCTECAESFQEIDQILKKEVLKVDRFYEIGNGKLCFFPVDNRTGTGVDVLRAKIESVVKEAPYTKEEVPITFLRALELFLEQEKDYLSLVEARDILDECGIAEDLHDAALDFLNKRGLLIYFSEPAFLREFIILQPQWMIKALTDVFFDFDEHEPPAFDDEFNRDFRKFEFERIMSKQLLQNIWTKKGFAEEEQDFFIGLMLKSSLICSYDFDSEESFLVPSLFSTSSESAKAMIDDDDDEEADAYKGPYFVLDFSGNYDRHISNDEGALYVRYLPFGVFERLVCLCVEYSGSVEDSITPIIGAKKCKLSFGVDIDFEIRLEEDTEGQPLWIKVATETDADMENVKELVKQIFAMVEGLKDDFFSKRSKDSKLAISLLVPSSEESGGVLAEYNSLKLERNKAKNLDKKIRPRKNDNIKVKLKEYSIWFEDADGQKLDLMNPDEKFEKLFAKDNALTTVVHLTQRPLKDGLKYHCFLSYKQSSAIDMVGKQFFILTSKGFNCWYDQQFAGNLNLESMQNGVRDSMCYILFLSKDIFPSQYVEAEVTMALKLKKPIIFLHHPDTGSKDYWSFGDYIANAPDIVKPLFAEVESIQLQRRYYLEQAVTAEIERKIVSLIEE